jgi:uncharacterized protein CbrC (UPF0167 family)
MSVKPIFGVPDLLAKALKKDFKAKFLKTMRKLSKKHNSQDTAVPFYLQTDAKYSDGEGFLFLAGKMKPWEKFAKANAPKELALRGYCFITTDDKGWLLVNIMPVAGKLKSKETLISKMLKMIASASKIGIQFLPGDFKDNPELDSKTEAMEETPDTPDLDDATDGADIDENAENAALADTTKLESGALAPFAEVRSEFIKRLNLWKQSAALDAGLEKWLTTFLPKYSADVEKDASLKQWVYLINSPIIAKLTFLDLKEQLAALSKESSLMIKDSFDNIIKLVEKYTVEPKWNMRQSMLTAIMGQAKGTLDKYVAEKSNPKRTAALQALIAKIKPVVDAMAVKPASTLEGITDQQVTGKTFGEKGVAGEQSASDKARAMRDATVDERALEVAKVLNLGKASNNDKNFAAALRWVNDAGDLAGKYEAATQKLYKKTSTLLADLTMVFGSGLRGQMLINRLENKESAHTKLAACFGCLGAGSFSQMFSSEKADAMSIIRNEYNAKRINEILTGTDDFAKAILVFLNKNPKLLAELKAIADVKTQKESIEKLKDATDDASKQKLADAQAELKKVNDGYLNSIIVRIQDSSLLGRVDGDQLQKDIKDWADRATQEERDAALTGDFMKNLAQMRDSYGPNGVDKKLYKHIERILSEPRANEEDKAALESNAIFNEVQKLAIEQGDKNRVKRWKENKETGAKFKAIILSGDSKNPQLAIVTRFAADMVKEGKTIATRDASQMDAKQKAALEALQLKYVTITPQVLKDEKILLAAFSDPATPANVRDAIFELAMGKVKGLMDIAGVHSDFVAELDETIRSNGARGAAYQALAKLAADEKGLTNIGIGDDIIEILEGIDIDSPEFVTIQKDKDMLEALKVRVIGRTGLGKGDWTKISKLLGLTGSLANPAVEIADAKNTFKGKRKADRSKILSPTEKEALGKEQAEAQKAPSYWAQRLDLEYKKGILVDKIAVSEMVMKAKKAGTAWDAVMTELLGINKKAHDYLLELLRNPDGTSGKNLSMTDYLQMLADKTFITQNTRMSKMREMVGNLSMQELVEQSFSFPKTGVSDVLTKAKTDLETAETALEAAKTALEAAKQTAETAGAALKTNDDAKSKLDTDLAAAAEADKPKIQTEIDKLVAARVALDKANQDAIAAATKAGDDLTAANNAIKPAQDALSKAQNDSQDAIDALVKNLDLTPDFTKLLNKALDPQFALEIKNLIREKVVSELANDPDAAAKAFGLDKADILLLTENVRAIALNEKELQSMTGTQYYGLTARTIVRDVATANHARDLSKGQEKLTAMKKGGDVEKTKAAKAEVAEKLQISGEEKNARIAAFEERKKQYDDRIKAVVNELISIAVKAATIPLAAIPFLPGVIEASIKAVVNNLVNKALGGDRAGGWDTVFKNMAKDAAKDIAISIINDALPMIAAHSSEILQDLAIKAKDTINRVEAIRKPVEALIVAYDFVKDKIDAVSNWGPIKTITDAFEAVTQKIEDVKTGLENALKSQGFIGEVAWGYTEDKIKLIEEQISGVTDFVDEVKAKAVEEITAKLGKVGELYNKLADLKSKVDTIISAYESTVANGKSTDGLSDEDKEKIEGLVEEFKDMVKSGSAALGETIAPPVGDAEAPVVDKSEMQQLGKDPKQDLLDIAEGLKIQGQAVPQVIKDLLLVL